MMLTRRGVRDSASAHNRSVSQAQFQSALYSHPRRSAADRLTRSSMTYDSSYNQYENTSPGRRRHSNDVVLPPVFKTPVRPPSSARRPAKRGPGKLSHSEGGQQRTETGLVPRGPRKLPKVKVDGGGPRLAWYHEDGALNLQALNHLANKQSFPRTQSYYDRLEKMKTRAGPSRSAGVQSTDDGLIALQFVDDDELTPRKRAERDSLLQLLLSCDDMTEQELEQIVRYISDNPDGESTPRSCLRKSPRPKSATTAEKKKKRGRKSPQENSRSKSVRFHRPTPSAGAEGSQSFQRRSSPPLPESPRPHSAPVPHAHFSPNPLSVVHRSSGPFHVASPATSPRALGSPDEVAYFHGYESPPEIPASPKPIPEPKITYYDESGEEIEEDIQRDQSNDGSKGEDRATSCEDAASCPDESPPSESSRRPGSPGSEVDPPEHLPDLDTPRVNRDTVGNQSSPQSRSRSNDSTPPRPRGDETLESMDSGRYAGSSRPDGSDEETLVAKQCTDSPPKGEEESSSPPKEDKPDTVEKEKSSPPFPETPRPESAPADQPPRPSRKSKHKSSKRHKSSRKSAESAECVQQSPPTDQAHENNSKPLKPLNFTPTPRPPPERSEPACEEPQPIPVISLIRGQLPAVPPYSPRIQLADSPALEPRPQGLTDSVQCQHSPRTSTVRDVESSSDSPRSGRVTDNRMKIWLTKTAWNRPVECVD